MPDGSATGHAITPQPSIDVGPAQLLVGRWTWEPAVSWPVGDLSEGPPGSVDLSLRILHDGLLPPGIGQAIRHRAAVGAALAVGGRAAVQPALWKRLAYLLQPSTEVLMAEVGPVEWPGRLFPYQIDGVRTPLSRDAVLLADEMGLGKTVEAVAALRITAAPARRRAIALWRQSCGSRSFGVEPPNGHGSG